MTETELTIARSAGFPLDPVRHPGLEAWLARANERPSVARDNADVIDTLGRLQQEGRSAFDPYKVQWRSDRLEWVMKKGFAEWLLEEMRSNRAFFPLPAPSS